MVSVLSEGTSKCAQKAMRDLKWRQRQTGKTMYELEINADHTLILQQNLASENDGTGTGGTVWPAAHMLARYLAKRRFPSGWTCLDLGTGTGAAGLAAAALGASKVALTDLSHALDMARCNVERNNLKAEVCALDWSNPRDSEAFDLVQQYDVVLAAECILPKLYPLEPFVGCLDNVIGPSTEALVAVELRTWHEFDPKARFVELCASQGLRVETITEGLDPDFIADDLEIWRVTRGASPEKQHDWVQVTKWDADEVRLDCDVREGRFSVTHVQQRNISERTWPSSIASSRAVVTGFWDVSKGARVLELGSGGGLAACVLARLGCVVTATDLPANIPHLEASLQRNGVLAKVQVRPLDWSQAPVSVVPFLDERWDVLLLNDCAYDAGACVHLARTVAALCYANPRMQILIANEPRTALEAFLRALGRFDWCPLLAPCLDASSALWHVDCLPPSRQPCAAVALYQS
jgi:predicted nicotinamide N-methyase